MALYPRCYAGLLAETDYTLISAVCNNFPCQIDLSSALSTYPAFTEGIKSSGNLGVYDPVLAMFVPSIVDFDLATSKLLLHFRGDISNGVNKQYYILTGSNFSTSNSPLVFSTYGYARRFGFNDFTDVSTTYDSVINDPAVETGGTATLGTAGQFGNGLKLNTSYFTFSNVSQLRNQGRFSMEYIFQIPSTLANQEFIYYDHPDGYNYLDIAIGPTPTLRHVLFYANGGTGGYAYFDLSGLTSGNKYHFVWSVYFGAGGGSANKVKLFIDGFQQVLTFVSGMPLTTHNVVNNPSFGTPGINLPEIIDEFGIIPSIDVPFTYAYDRYKQFFNSAFWTISQINLERMMLLL